MPLWEFMFRMQGVLSHAVSGLNSHHGRLHHRDGGVRLASGDRDDFGCGHADRAAHAGNAAAGDEYFADCGGHEVDLEFDAEDRGALGHACETGVTAGGIGDGRDGTSVDEAVLLLD